MDSPRVQEALRVDVVGDGEIFRDARDWNVGNLHIVNHNVEKSSLSALLKPVPDASHTRNRTISPPNSRCFPGTREHVIKKIHSWIDSSLLLNKPHIMWVYGYAGCGKSAIAQVVAEYMSSRNRLAGSFFFFRGSGDRSKVTRFARTIASQVAAAIPATAPIIRAAIEATPGLLSPTTTTLGSQMEHLVYNPINEIKWDQFAASFRRGPYLIVLDGVDECEDRDDVASFIAHMINFFGDQPRIPLRFLITSRVENHIYQRLHSSKQVKLFNLVQHTSDVDISTALDVAIAEEKRGLVFACESSWPCRDDRLKLVKHIGGSFIFMTTLIKLLFDSNNEDRLTPMERLPLLLALRPDFDALYKRTLKLSKDIPHFHDIISTVALAKEPLSISQIAELLEVETFHVSKVLVNLHAVIQVPGDDRTPVTLWHTSLRDFLCSEGRSRAFFAPPEFHRRLAYRCTSLAALSVPSATSPASAYAKRFALGHWSRFLHTTEDSSLSISEELGSLIAHIQAEFPRDYRSVISACFCPPLAPGLKRTHEVVARTRSLEDLRALTRQNPDLNSLFPDGQVTPSPLEVASRTKKWNTVRELVNANPAGVNTRFHGSEDKIIVPLHSACFFKEMDLIHFLLEKGADPNVPAMEWHLNSDPATGWGFYGSPLAFAAHEGKVDLVIALLACGADPDMGAGWIGPPLCAVASGMIDSDEIARLLLQQEAEPNIKGRRGRTPLHEACLTGYAGVVTCLLEFGGDPTVKDDNGNTPFHDACIRGGLRVADLLLKANADPSIRNKNGKTGLQRAQDTTLADTWSLQTELLQRGIIE